MENFEALGRYVTAKEQAQAFANQRNNHLSTAVGIIERSRNPISGRALAYDFDATPAIEALNKAAEAHSNMMTAVEEANRQAEACGKPKLIVEKPYTSR